VSPVKYELDFISQKTTFFIVTAVKTSDVYCLFINIVHYVNISTYTILLTAADTSQETHYVSATESSRLMLCKI
jgi:hypothetical protein